MDFVQWSLTLGQANSWFLRDTGPTLHLSLTQPPVKHQAWNSLELNRTINRLQTCFVFVKAKNTHCVIVTGKYQIRMMQEINCVNSSSSLWRHPIRKTGFRAAETQQRPQITGSDSSQSWPGLGSGLQVSSRGWWDVLFVCQHWLRSNWNKMGQNRVIKWWWKWL